MFTQLLNSDKNQTFIFIDGSYFCFYRYYSLLKWWKSAYPETLIEDPYQNEIFVEKFKKTFIEHVKTIPKKLNIDKSVTPILIVGKDCRRENIWRNKLFDKYKANRTNEGFMGGPFFKMVYDENLFIDSGVKTILKHPQLEADDCIALTTKYILEQNAQADIYIITSDKDYLQLAGPRVKLFNLGYKELTDQKTSTGNPKCDLFCKIIMGDSSDNIPSVFPKCGPKTALKYYENQTLFLQKLFSCKEYSEQFKLNSTIICFDDIPNDLKEEFMKSIL